jgi:hypothetical protein
MDGAVMAGHTFLIDHFLVVKPEVRNVAGGTLFCENGVRGRKRASGIHAAVAAQSEPRDAQNSERRRGNRKPQSPSPQRARPLEIIEIDPLRELLGCARSWQEFLSFSTLNCFV